MINSADEVMSVSSFSGMTNRFNYEVLMIWMIGRAMEWEAVKSER